MNITKNFVNEEVFKSVIENSTDLTIITDAEGVGVYVSPQCKDVIGYTKKDILGKVMPDFIHPDDKKKCREVWKRVMAGEPLRNFEYRILDKKGKERWVSHSAKYITTDKVNVGMQNIIRDDTERKQVEEALRESEERFHTLFDHAPLGYQSLDSDGRFIEVNQAWLEMLGYTREEVIGKWFGDFLSPEVVDAFRERFPIFKAQGKIHSEFFMLHKSGSKRYIAFEGRISNHADGSFKQTHCILSDETGRKQAEEELRKTQKLESIGTLAAGIAHDFNNMLGGLFGYIDLALEETAGNKQLIYYLEKAISAHARAKELTAQLLTFTKGGGPRKSVVSVQDILQETKQMALSGTNIRYKHTPNKRLLRVEADKGQLSQVFTNILINSRQAMPDGGTITVACTNRKLKNNQVADLSEGQYIQILIRDTGTGIPEELLPKVFDPFFTTRQLGSGLGLATSYSIISRHGGHIAIDSEPGIGTEITILLPASGAKLRKEQDKPLPVSKDMGRILIMDDDEILLDVACALLKKLGYSFESAKNGGDAIKLYKMSIRGKKKFDAVILDLTVVGGMGGVMTINKLLEIDPKVKGIVSSGYSDDPVLAEPEKYGFFAKIAKPYRKSELASTLDEVIRGK